MKRRRRPIRPTPYRRYEATAIVPARARRGSVARRREPPQAEARELDRPRLVSGSIALTMALVSLWIGLSDSFYVGTPKVTGQARAPADEIVAGSGLAGLHVWWVNAGVVEAALLRTTPSLRAAQVSCVLPADCAITVAEREPVFAWRWGQAAVWVDQDGAVFPARADAPDLPLVESTDAPPPQPGQRIDPQLLTAISAAMAALPDVRAFRYSAGRGLEFGDANGYPVYLGAGSNMADRALVWRALRDDLAARGIKPAFIDVRFPLAPYYGK
jgi:cell division septal protein FtsQ